MKKRIKNACLKFTNGALLKKTHLPLLLLALILPVTIGFMVISDRKSASGEDLVVDVIPLARTAYFQFRLDLLTGLPTDFYQPGRGSILQIPETHKAELYWCEAESDCVNNSALWKKAQPFVRVQDNGGYGDPINFHTIRDPRMATMLFGLEEGKSYDYKVDFSGVGYPTSPIQGRFSTLISDIVPGGNVSTIYNNINVRTTVQNIISNGSSGKTIEFASSNPAVPAVFRDRIIDFYDDYDLTANADNWVTIQGREGHKIIFDGSDPAYDVVNQNKWVECNASNNYCSNGSSAIPDGTKIFRTINQYYDPANEDKVYSPTDPLRPKPASVYYEKTMGEDAWILQNVSSGTACGVAISADACIGSVWQGLNTLSNRAARHPNEGAFVNKDGYIYVHLRNGQDPNSVNIKIPVIKSPIELNDAQYVTINNITFQYFKDQFGARLYLANSHDITIKNVEFKGILSAIGAGSNVLSPKRNIIIKNCKFSLRGLNPEFNSETGQWEDTVWEHIKATPEETWAIRTNGTGVSIIDSKFYNYNNAVTGGEFFIPQKDYSIANHQHPMAWEIDNNYFEGISDDAVELETWAIGIAITRNKFDKNYKDISSAPLNGGPLYSLRNISIQRGEFYSAYKQAPIKFGNRSYGFDNGYKFFANNTFINVNESYGVNNTTSPGFDQSGPTANLNIYNNYMVSDNAPILLSDDAYSCYPQVFDHNLYMATRHNLPFGGQPAGQFAMVGTCPQQGDNSSMRGAMSFQDWQDGINHRVGSTNWPTVPSDTTYHSTTLPWIHDPHGKFLPYYNNDAPSDYNLINPVNALGGNFTPKADSPNVGMGMDLTNITYDVGPGWATYDEPKGMVTAGAVPAEDGTTPIVALSASTTTYQGISITLEPSVNNADVFQWSKVGENDITFEPANGAAKNVTITSNSITGKDTSYKLKFTATNSTSGIVSDNNYIDIHIHKLADIDGDNIINFTDFSTLLSSWGTPVNPMANIIREGLSIDKVDFQDFSALLSKWGS